MTVLKQYKEEREVIRISQIHEKRKKESNKEFKKRKSLPIRTVLIKYPTTETRNSNKKIKKKTDSEYLYGLIINLYEYTRIPYIELNQIQTHR